MVYGEILYGASGYSGGRIWRFAMGDDENTDRGYSDTG
jgi:short subunit dehydrogenase-like uncharacterized protein